MWPFSSPTTLGTFKEGVGAACLSIDPPSRMSAPKQHSYVVRTKKNQNLINKAKALSYVPWCEKYERMISGMKWECSSCHLEDSLLITFDVENLDINSLGRLHSRRIMSKSRDCAKNTTNLRTPRTPPRSTGKSSHTRLAAIVGRLGNHSFARPIQRLHEVQYFNR